MTITPDKLSDLGMAMYGMEWKSPLARAIGVNIRTMQRIAAGTAPISETMESRIRSILGLHDAPALNWPRDEWIIGDGPEHAPGERREYIIHTVHPRFIGRVVAIDEITDAPEPFEGDTDDHGVIYFSGDSAICEVVWIDPPPGPDGLTALMDAAADALENL